MNTTTKKISDIKSDAVKVKKKRGRKPSTETKTRKRRTRRKNPFVLDPETPDQLEFDRLHPDLGKVVAETMEDMKPYLKRLKKKYSKTSNLSQTGLRNVLIDESMDDVSKNDWQINHLNEDQLKKIKYQLWRTGLYYTNRPLITKVAGDFYHNHKDINFSLLRDQATYGMLKAMETFDPDRGFRFTTFAFVVMNNQLKQLVKKHDKVRTVPTFTEKVRTQLTGKIVRIHQVKYNRKIKNVEHVFDVVVSDGHSEQELLYLYNIRFKVGDHVKRGDVIGDRSNFGLKIDSIDRPLGTDSEGNEFSVSDEITRIKPDDQLKDTNQDLNLTNLTTILKKMVATLDPIDRVIMYLRFPILIDRPAQGSLKQREIGELINVNQPNVSKRQRDCVKELRAYLKYHNIDASFLKI